MPYKDKEKQREYQRNWMRKRRDDFFKDKSCVKCGSVSDLEIDHINPEEKVRHAIWSYSKEKRDTEIAKCQVLCNECHKKKTNEQRPKMFKKLDEKTVMAIFNSNGTCRQVAEEYGVVFQTISDIRRGKTHRDITKLRR